MITYLRYRSSAYRGSIPGIDDQFSISNMDVNLSFFIVSMIPLEITLLVISF